jgi:hypothetical protein
MGLDMYLMAYERGATPAVYDEATGEEVGAEGREVGYWRKANQIHSWFVQHCQNGVDECQNTLVPREKLQELRDTVKMVLDDHSKAEELLAPQGGFFFGSTEIDDWYFEDLNESLQILDQAIFESETYDIYYQSSW